MDTGEAKDRDEPESPRAARRRVVLIAVLAVVAVVVAFVAVDAVFLSRVRIDKYDDTSRGTRPGTQRVDFGQFFSPDGDGCWSENDYRIYFCDLVSIGGLHWDTGDLGDVEQPAAYLGSGVLCAMSEDGVRCWEWSKDVQPRPARVPDGAVFHRIVGGAGFVCGQTPDYVTVACWTIGVDQPEYQQATHRFSLGSEWVMDGASDDRLGFWVLQRGTGRSELFHAFTGAELTGPVEVPGPLETETTP